MTIFNYTSVDTQGKIHKGVLQGDSPRNVRSQLRDKGLIPVDVKQVVESSSTETQSKFYFRKKVKLKELSLFTFQFSTLLSAGLPVAEALLSVANQAERNYLKTVLLGVRSAMLEGLSLANAMDLYPHVFPKLYRSTVAAGEKAGHLENVLSRLADYLEKQQTIQQKVTQALVYPTLLTIVSISIVVFLLVYAVPKMVTIFEQSGQALPPLTTALLAISHFMQAYGIYLLVILIVAGISARQLLKIPKIRYQYQNLVAHIPFIGKLIKLTNSARFSRTLGILYAASVPVLDAMQTANSLVTLLPMQEAIVVAIKKVEEGVVIHRALQETNYFTQLNIQLIASGERSGSLEAMLEKSANYQDNYLSSVINTGLSLFEPLMILLMGTVVLLIVLAILLPIFQINQFLG